MLRLKLTMLALLGLGVGVHAAEPKAPTDQQLQFFETKIRPVLANHCYDCHGPDEQSSELRLDTASGLFQGGGSGPPVVPGQPDQSLLLAAISHTNPELKMPPDEKLPAEHIENLKRWIEMGAPHPDYSKVQMQSDNADLETERQFWAFQPPRKSAVPTVKDASWPKNDIDRFILAKLEEKNLRPAAKADKRTLIRRATFDLTGLPPTVEDVEAFLADESDEAFAKVVERLLASPQYGERWARHWLDIARYADSNGLDENIAHGNAWRYRDYVVKSFNEDKPYDQFLIEQLAGDLLEPTGDRNVDYERLVATGLLSLGPKVLAEVDEGKMEMDIIDEQIDTLGRALMGLTLGCARCHNHKFDPIPTSDYYALAGIFKSTRTMEHFRKVARWHENPIPGPEDLKRQEEHKQKVAEKKEAIEAFVASANQLLLEKCDPPGKLPDKPETQYDAETKEKLKKLRDELAALEKAAPEMPSAMGVQEGQVMDLQIHIRGSHLSLGAKVKRGFPRVLVSTTPPPIGEKESGRLQLAHWLTSSEHPLTARVMANRIWRWHFGEGLVRTPDNFGRLGEAPDNQPLLDWLACRFVEDGWSFKQMHRLIMLSSTYQMSSEHNAQAAAVDPENRLMWRSNIKRLEAEAIRDSLLSVSGLLDLSVGGSLLTVKNRDYFFHHTSQDSTTYDTPRRSIYLPVVRNHLYEVFMLFDYSDASVLNGDRASSTVAPQALFLMNGEMVHDASTAMARNALQIADARQRIQDLHLRNYGRPASDSEIERSQQFVQMLQERWKDENDAELRAWAALCQVLVSANEFIYVR